MTNELGQAVAAANAAAQANIWTSWIQLGFAGLCLILLAIGTWGIAKLAKVLWALNTSVTTNTEVTRNMGTHIDTLGDNVQTLTMTVARSNGVQQSALRVMPKDGC